MAATTTIRLTPKLRARVHAIAKQSSRSAHSVIVEAVERHVAYEEQLRGLVKDALTSEQQIGRLAELYGGEDVRVWLERLGRGETPARPKPWPR